MGGGKEREREEKEEDGKGGGIEKGAGRWGEKGWRRRREKRRK